jgi:hypothetical protein
VPSAAPDPILTLDRSLHKILKARKCDPIGYLLLIYRDCLPFPNKLEAHYGLNSFGWGGKHTDEVRLFPAEEPDGSNQAGHEPAAEYGQVDVVWMES